MYSPTLNKPGVYYKLQEGRSPIFNSHFQTQWIRMQDGPLHNPVSRLYLGELRTAYPGANE